MSAPRIMRPVEFIVGALLMIAGAAGLVWSVRSLFGPPAGQAVVAVMVLALGRRIVNDAAL